MTLWAVTVCAKFFKLRSMKKPTGSLNFFFAYINRDDYSSRHTVRHFLEVYTLLLLVA